MPLTAAKGAKKKADDLFSKIVRSRGYCQSCGSTRNLQTAHVISRRYSATRTDLANAFCACATCHARWTDYPVEFGEFVLDVIGDDAYEALRVKSLSRVKFDWLAEVERLRPLLAELETAG
jgi:5-methylcytosine-specific restriction endonuclease McrA